MTRLDWEFIYWNNRLIQNHCALDGFLRNPAKFTWEALDTAAMLRNPLAIYNDIYTAELAGQRPEYLPLLLPQHLVAARVWTVAKKPHNQRH